MIEFILKKAIMQIDFEIFIKIIYKLRILI
jgi:hypothetical protein